MNGISKMIVCLVLTLALAVPAAAANYDLVIKNGRVMDPETKLDAVRNVGIKNGRIQTITDQKLTGTETIDAKGMVVAPGFIDIHSHGQGPYDFKLKLRDGVTSVLEIEAGAYPVEDYYKSLEGKALANYGTSVGHVWARMAVLDKVDPKGLGLYSGALHEAMHDGANWNAKTADPSQQQAIVAAVENGLRQGGLGIGFPIGYYTAVGNPEIMAVSAMAKRYDSFITTHVRFLAQAPPTATGYLGMEEFLAVAKVNEVPLIMHHLPSNCLGLTPECLETLDEARQTGMKIGTEFYPYTAGSNIIGADYLKPGFQERMGMDYKDIMWVKTGEMLTKETFEKYLKEDPNGFVIMHHIKEEDMLAAFRHPGTWIGSDGMPFTDASGKPLPLDAPYGEGNGHPRGAGAYAKALRMVREQSVVPLMEALAKMSYYQAKWLEDMVPDLRYRGRLQPGAVADITIFDFENVRDNADFTKGKQSLPSTGIPYVIVNGTAVVKDSKVLKDVYPGQPIRNAVLD